MTFVKRYLSLAIIGTFTVIMAIMGFVGLPFSTVELLEKHRNLSEECK